MDFFPNLMFQIHVKKSKKLLPLMIFSFYFLIYLASAGGHPDSFDGVTYFLMSENLALHGAPTLNIHSPSAQDLGFDVHQYIRIRASLDAWPAWQKHAPDMRFGDFRDDYLKKVNWESFYAGGYLVLPFLAAPLYVIAIILHIPPTAFVFLFTNSIIIASSATVMFMLGKEMFKSERIGFVLSLIFGVTSFIWPYISSFFSNPLAILFFMLSMYFILRQKNENRNTYSLLAGITLGLSFLSHLESLLLLPPMLIY